MFDKISKMFTKLVSTSTVEPPVPEATMAVVDPSEVDTIEYLDYECLIVPVSKRQKDINTRTWLIYVNELVTKLQRMFHEASHPNINEALPTVVSSHQLIRELVKIEGSSGLKFKTVYNHMKLYRNNTWLVNMTFRSMISTGTSKSVVVYFSASTMQREVINLTTGLPLPTVNDLVKEIATSYLLKVEKILTDVTDGSILYILKPYVENFDLIQSSKDLVELWREELDNERPSSD